MAYDKGNVRKELTVNDIFQLLLEWGGDPEYTSFGIVSATICHNPPGEGSRKLYYYNNSTLFQCYSSCGSFDIFELTIKVFQIQHHVEMTLNDAILYIARKFNISQTITDDAYESIDWKYLNLYDRFQNIDDKDYHVQLKKYDSNILSYLNYKVKLLPWLEEGISQEVINKANIGFFPGGQQISIPHYDAENNFIGLRGRTLCRDDAEKYGKYRPIKIGNELYNHPLGMNLYGYNWNKGNIKQLKKAIIWESEKSVLKMASYFNWENNISVACCGSNISMYQMQLLLDLNVEEVIIAFDRQFQQLGDDECKHLTDNLKKIHSKYNQYTRISFIFDKHMITDYKASPIDHGPDIFMKLFKERVML